MGRLEKLFRFIRVMCRNICDKPQLNLCDQATSFDSFGISTGAVKKKGLFLTTMKLSKVGTLTLHIYTALEYSDLCKGWYGLLKLK